MSLLSLQHTDGEQHGVCEETKYLNLKLVEELGFIFIWEIVRYSILQHREVQKSSQPRGKSIKINLSKYFSLAKLCEYEDTSTCLFNRQDMEICDHS